MECSLGMVGECKAVGDDFQEHVSESRIASIRLSSKRRGDGLHQDMDNISSLQVHRKCVSLYTSNSLVERVEKRRLSKEFSEARLAKQLRSDAPTDGCGAKFDFRKQCLYCLTPIPCILPCEYDVKIPISRRKSAYLVCTDFVKYGTQLLSR